MVDCGLDQPPRQLLREERPSAAGVALMGQSRGVYTFGRHLVWTPAIALGYVLSILTHFYVNAHLFADAATR